MQRYNATYLPFRPDLPVSKMVSWQAVAGDGGSRGHEECEHPGAEAGQSPTSTNAPGGERYVTAPTVTAATECVENSSSNRSAFFSQGHR